MPVLVKPKNFAEEVLESKIPVLVDFFGERCAPCRLQRPILVELGEEHAGQLKICMFNTDKEPRESDTDYKEKFRTLVEYNVMHLPTLLLFSGGALRRTLIGLHTGQELLGILGEEGLAFKSLAPYQRIGDQPGPDDGQHGGECQQAD